MQYIINLADVCIDENVNSVNAKDLHEFMGIKSKYSDWIKNRIRKFSFVENEDYVIVQTKKQGNNATIKEYYITLDMAKELSMVENNPKGREARQYFIKVEKKSREPQPYLIDGKDPRFIIGGHISVNNHLRKIIEGLKKQLALPVPHVDVESYKKHIARLQNEVNKKEALREHFELQSGNLLVALKHYKKAPTIIKSMLGKFLDFPDVYDELEKIILMLENRRVG